MDAEALAQRADTDLARQFGPQRCDLAVRETAVLAAPQQVSSSTGASSSSARSATSPSICSTNHGSTPEASRHLLDAARPSRNASSMS